LICLFCSSWNKKKFNLNIFRKFVLEKVLQNYLQTREFFKNILPEVNRIILVYFIILQVNLNNSNFIQFFALRRGIKGCCIQGRVDVILLDV